MEWLSVITSASDRRSGKPCIRGLRITACDVLEYLAAGMTPDEIGVDFPELTLEDIRAVPAFATSMHAARRLPPSIITKRRTDS
jgi:uncharacterized protein (DUF433 family)